MMNISAQDEIEPLTVHMDQNKTQKNLAFLLLLLLTLYLPYFDIYIQFSHTNSTQTLVHH